VTRIVGVHGIGNYHYLSYNQSVTAAGTKQRQPAAGLL